jgi:transcriptional regulator with XRE-family HTH domain
VVRAARTPATDLRHWLRELRISSGLSQEELAAAVGTDRRNIRRWELEGHDPNGSMLIAVLEALGVRIEPPPPGGGPGAVNARLQELEARVRAFEDVAARRQDELLGRLDAQREELARLSERLTETSLRRE